MEALGIASVFGTKNPLAFMDFRGVQELTTFFEPRVSAYQLGVTGAVAFGEEF